MSSSSIDAFPAVQEIMLEFRAGKMFLEGKKVVPDTRKGLVRIARGDEGLVHFQWLDRTQNAVEDETNTDNDSQLCSSVNDYINRPLELLGEEEPGESLPLQVSEDMAEDDISSRAANLVIPNLGVEASSGATSSGPVKLEDLQRILSNLGPAESIVDPDGGLELGDILKPDLIMPLMETLPLEQRLSPYLPEGTWSPEDILELLQSPSFRQQVDSFTYVLRTGQIDLSQFGIDPSKYNFTVLSFLEALEDSVSKSLESEGSRQDQDLISQTCNDPMDESK